MDPAEQPRELYLVEGDSAAIAVESACNHDFQAVLPMQGKPLNAWKASQAKVANYELYSQLLHVLGESLGSSSFPNPSSFDRIHLLFDPDADGIHCTVLMLWFFHRWLPHWLASGRIFAVAAPVCELASASAAKVWYPKDHREVERVLAECASLGTNDIQRRNFRGLASIGSELLARTCVDPKTRRLSVLRPEDAVAALKAFGAAP
jgi:DNA gyrase subunit B/topoisomerase-4 subunit B